MSIEEGIKLSEVPDERLGEIALGNLKAIFNLYSNIAIEGDGTIILSTRKGTRIKLETVFQKILQINGIEICPKVISYNPMRIQFNEVIGLLSDQRSDSHELVHDDVSNDNVSNGDDLKMNRELLLPESKISTTKKSATEKIINILQSILRWLRIM